MASQTNTFPIQFSLNKENNNKVNEILQAKWRELVAWKESSNISNDEFDFTFEEFADEVRLSL